MRSAAPLSSNRPRRIMSGHTSQEGKGLLSGLAKKFSHLFRRAPATPSAISRGANPTPVVNNSMRPRHKSVDMGNASPATLDAATRVSNRLGRKSARFALRAAPVNREVSEVFDHVLLSLPPNTELEAEDILQVFGYPRNLTELYEIGERIGSGSFGIVRRCIDKRTGVLYAVKAIPKTPRNRKCTPKYLLKLQNEVDCMRQLGASLNAVFLQDVFEDDTHVYLVMELCEGGGLMERLQGVKLTEARVARIIKSVLQFLAQCHSKGLVYRDVKPDNFLFLSKSGNSPLKATDFGLAVRWRPADPPLTSRSGTPAYMAPEVIKQRYDYRCDVWSAGVLMYQLLTGRWPFFDDLRNVTLPQVFSATLTETIDLESAWIRNALSGPARDLLKRLLQKDPESRISLVDALAHPWLTRQALEDMPLEKTVVQRLQRFATLGHLKQVVLSLIVEEVSREGSTVTTPALKMVDKVKEIFQSLDTDKSGDVTFDELVAGLGKQGYNITQDELRQLFNRVDVNHDGRMQINEFISAFLDWEKIMSDRLWDVWVDKAFDKLDKDHSGAIDFEEILNLLPEAAAVSREGSVDLGRPSAAKSGMLNSNGTPSEGHRVLEARRMLREADRDQDGKITRTEFRLLLSKGDVPDTLEAYDDRAEFSD